MPKKNEFKIFYAVSFAWQLGFLIIAPIGGFLLLGYWLDNIFGASHLFLIIGIITGIAITVYEVCHMLAVLIHNDDNDEEKK